MAATAKPTTRPAIVLSQTDADRLSALAIQMEASSPQASNLLLDEIERAEVLPDDQTPANVVGMNSTVEFLDGSHGSRRTVQLVYPGEADIASGKISVLTPVGAGLIGLSQGQSIVWPDRDGHQRVLKILRVSRQGRRGS